MWYPNEWGQEKSVLDEKRRIEKIAHLCESLGSLLEQAPFFARPQRLHQASFREAVITAYNGHCAQEGVGAHRWNKLPLQRARDATAVLIKLPKGAPDTAVEEIGKLGRGMTRPRASSTSATDVGRDRLVSARDCPKSVP